jgi:aminopeptidase N
VTCDDFVQAMQDASGVDLAQFRRWYDVAGTPVLDCSAIFAGGTCTLTVRQSMSPPFHIPLAVKIGPHETVLSLKQPQESFAFQVAEKPVPSLLRGFSAPVVLNYPYTEDELVHLLAHDDDAFSRWEAGQRLAAGIILQNRGEPSRAYVRAALRVLAEKDHAFVAEALTLPSETFLAEQLEVVDPDALHEARDNLRLRLAEALQPELTAAYRALQSEAPYSPDAASAGKRALKNLCLAYLAELGLTALADEQFRRSDNMTDAMAALTCLANADCLEREPALQAFYDKWQGEPLVVDKWLAVQAASRLPGTLARVRELLGHPAFDLKVPNKVYALIRSFSANHVRFHAADGAGYGFLTDRVIELNALNPQVAARMARGFDRWRKFDAERQAHARRQLERIRDAEGLSRDVAEIVGKSLG